MSDQSRQGRALWVTRLASAFRTALACSIVACATLYGPASLRHQVAFPAFSYLTAILIVTNATLGDAICGSCLALFATLQTVCPAMLVFWFIGPTKFSPVTTALTVALASVVVVLQRSTQLLAKRIALGQIVIIYVVGFIGGPHTDPLMHPIHVAATTAMGATASVCATLLPFPRLASLQVRDKRKAVVENAGERLKLLVKAFLTDDDRVAAASISKAQLLSSSAPKLLHSIKHYQESMQWERLPLKICGMRWSRNDESLQDLGMGLRGMELALSSTATPPSPWYQFQNELAMRDDDINALEKHVALALNQANNASLPSDDPINAVQIMPTHHNFFTFCLKLLHSKCQLKRPTKLEQQVHANYWRERLIMAALKLAVSLGAAVFLGLMYSDENGFWASLAVAISFTSDREPTFRAANVKVHGTMLGSVYGVLSFVVFPGCLAGRLLCLLPWFVFTTFLRHSTMYGSAGGVSAVVGALVVLGRTNYGSPTEFAFVRMVETFIGLSISIAADVIFQPTRASKLAKIQLTATLRALQNCIRPLSFGSSVEDLRALGIQVCELKKLIDEAEAEPNLWFLPFQSSCYGKLFDSLSKIVDFLALSTEAMDGLKQNLSMTTEDSWGKLVETLDGGLEKFKEVVNVSVTCYADVSSLKSLRVLEKEGEKNDICGDVEMGEPQKIGKDEIMEKENLIVCFLQHSAEVIVDQRGAGEDGKREAILSLRALAFCLSNLMREIDEIGEATRELIQWENPCSHVVDFNEISSKIGVSQK